MKKTRTPELQLQIDLADELNKRDFSFEVVSKRFDLVDELHQIVSEVKREEHAPEQLLYAAGDAIRENREIKFVALMNFEFLLFFECPSRDMILDFRERVIEENGGKAMRPSAVPERYRRETYEILDEPILIRHIKEISSLSPESLFSRSKQEQTIRINLGNLPVIKNLLERYKINVGKFLLFVFNLYSRHRSFIQINDDGWIFDSKGMIPFSNDDTGKTAQRTLYGYRGDYVPIKDPFDVKVISSLLIGDVEIEQLLHGLDRLEKMGVRREHGRFFTTDLSAASINITEESMKDDLIDQLMLDLCLEIDPDVVVEPYAGAGTLIKGIITSKKYQGAINDIAREYVQILEKKYNQFDSKWKFTYFDLPKCDVEDILNDWGVSSDQRMLILTNPPYGTSSTNKLATTNKELGTKVSRNLSISYPHDLGDRYGRGDLLLPTIGKLIDICQVRGQGILAFFSPHGLFCGRKKYNKLFRSLLQNFSFKRGYLFSGQYFNSVRSAKPIAFTIWEYGEPTQVDSISFNFKDRTLGFRKVNLLKDYWRYDRGDKGCPEEHQKRPFLAVTPCERFNSLKGKFFTLTSKPRDGKLCKHTCTLKLENLPYSQELLISLWSTVVGVRSMTEHPLYLDNAYVHLPDFCEEPVLEIISLAILHNLIHQMSSPQKYSKGHIGFDINRHLVFGDETGCSDYSDEVMQIIIKFSKLLINKETKISVIKLFEWLRDEADVYNQDHAKLMSTYRRLLKKEVSKRLREIDYFGDYIPFPRNF